MLCDAVAPEKRARRGQLPQLLAVGFGWRRLQMDEPARGHTPEPFQLPSFLVQHEIRHLRLQLPIGNPGDARPRLLLLSRHHHVERDRMLDQRQDHVLAAAAGRHQQVIGAEGGHEAVDCLRREVAVFGAFADSRIDIRFGIAFPCPGFQRMLDRIGMAVADKDDATLLRAWPCAIHGSAHGFVAGHAARGASTAAATTPGVKRGPACAVPGLPAGRTRRP